MMQRRPSAAALRRWLRPLWSGGVLDEEPLFFLQEAGRSAATATLLFAPRRLTRLARADGAQVFEAGKDFRWEPGNRTVTLLPGSRIPFKTAAQMYPPPGAPQSIAAAADGKSHLFFGEGHLFHDLQSVVSYRHRDTWPGPTPASAAALLPATLARLKEKRPLQLAVLGDSISAGGNASGVTGVPPFQPAYPALVAEGLKAAYGSPVTLANLSVGGMASEWGIGMAEKLAAENPDLIVVAFGMNDASGRLPAERYADNIRQIVETVRRLRPETEAVLVATMTGNAEWSYAAPTLYPQYRDALRRLSGPGIALADLTTLWETALTRKRYADLTGNGVNHPNDFGHRLYAQTILRLLTP